MHQLSTKDLKIRKKKQKRTKQTNKRTAKATEEYDPIEKAT